MENENTKQDNGNALKAEGDSVQTFVSSKDYNVDDMDFSHDLDEDGEMEVICRDRWSYINKHEAADLITHLQKVFNLS